MTLKLTLFAVCAFEVALILFMVGWTGAALSGGKFEKNAKPTMGGAMQSGDVVFHLHAPLVALYKQ